MICKQCARKTLTMICKQCARKTLTMICKQCANNVQDHARSKKFNNYPYYVLNSSVYGDLEIMVVV